MKVMFGSLEEINDDEVNESAKSWTAERLVDVLKSNTSSTLYALVNNREYFAEAFSYFMAAFRQSLATRVTVTEADGKTIAWGQKDREVDSKVFAAGKAAAKLVMPQLSDKIDAFSLDKYTQDNDITPAPLTQFPALADKLAAATAYRTPKTVGYH